MAYDAGRARAVLFGGAAGGTWEWDGSRWAEATPAAGNPAARTEHALAYDAARGRVLLFGGRSGGVLFDDTWSWDGRAWTREYPAASPSARAFHAMAYDTGRGRVVLFGGRTDPALDVRSSETWEWDGTTWARQQPALEPPARERATLTYDPTRRASVLFGGRGRDPSSFIGGDAALADTWEWTGTAWRSVVGSAAPSGRYGHAAGLDATCGCVAVFGGATGTGAIGSVYGDTWVLGAGGSWTRPATTGPGGRFGMASAMVDGVWTLFGGRSSTAFSTERQDTWAWNAAAARWTEVTPSALTPGPRYGHSMAYEPSSGKTNLVFGRTTAGGVVGTAGSTDHWAYDSRGWALVPGVAFNMPPTPRFGASGAVTGAGVLTLFGGRATDAAGNPTTYAAGTSGWNGASWSSSLVGAPPLRTAAGLAGAGASGGLFLFGGENSTGVLGDTWTWNGSGWAQLAPAAAPSARAGHTMVHDSVRARALAFGGSNGTTTNDETWAFDGTSWTRLTPTRSPAPRAYAAAAFDGRRGWGLLFGGNGLVFNSSSLDDLWVHDGTTWRLESPDRGAPPPRQRGAAVYDAARDRVVLFGGLQVTFPANSLVSEDRDLGDTWELLPPATPAVTASFDWSAAGVASSAVLETRLEAVGGGTGYTVAAPGGSALHGASLEGWDAQAGAWRQLATNAAPLSTPAGLVATTAAGEATRWFLRGTTAHVRLRPLASSGNGPAHAAVAVDAVQVRVKYHR
jgi:hypothetical protein